MRVEISYWGRLLFKTHIEKEKLNNIKKLCNKSSDLDHRSNLAGNFKHEYRIDVDSYMKEMHEVIQTFIPAYEKFYGNKCEPFFCNQAWVNYMYKGDFNPPHIHLNCSFSSVLFLQVPEILKEEHKNYKGSLNGGGSGSITFLNGDNSDDNLSMKSFFPEEGDFFMFPSSLLHYVWPFKSDCERVSIAANFEKTDLKK